MTNRILVVVVVTEQQGSCGQEMFATYCLHWLYEDSRCDGRYLIVYKFLDVKVDVISERCFQLQCACNLLPSETSLVQIAKDLN
jgi:hypothetical protein